MLNRAYNLQAQTNSATWSFYDRNLLVYFATRGPAIAESSPHDAKY